MSASEPLVLKPASGWQALNLRDVWRYRELLLFFVWRDIKVRYKQTVLGVMWVLIRPVLSVLMFSVVFGRLAKLPSEGIPYPLFVLAAMIPWNFFAGAVGAASMSLVGNSQLITKVYFPRLVIPIATVLTNLFDMAVSFLLLGALMAWYGFVPGAAAIITVPAIFLLTALIALAISLWLGALNVTYRDVGNTIPFLLQIWMYATPVVYALTLIPVRWRWLASLNPMTGIVEACRSFLLGTPLDGRSLLVSVVLGSFTLFGGLFYFRRAERTFADTV